MTKTTNYQLNQWDATDRVLRTDFNSDNQKIDAALGEKVEIQFGNYTGNGGSSQKIALEGTPCAVYVCPADGAVCDLYGIDSLWGGLAFTDHPAIRKGQNLVKIEDGGFRVYYSTSSGSEHILTNQEDVAFHYIAFFVRA